MSDSLVAPKLELDKGASLPFHEKKQSAVLGHALLNSGFMMEARLKIEPAYFLDTYTAKIWKFLQEFWIQFGRGPNTLDEFQGISQFTVFEQGERNRLFKQMALAQSHAQEYGLDVIVHELTIWLKSQFFKTYITKAIATHNAGDGIKNSVESRQKIEESFALARRGLSEVESATFEPARAVDFNDIGDGTFLEAQESDLESGCTFGCKKVDELLNVNCKNSSALLRGDHTTLLTSTNSGKSSTLLTIIGHNIRIRKSVLLLTHEGRPLDIKNRLVQSLMGSTRQQMMEEIKGPSGLKRFLAMQQVLKAHLIYLPMNRPGTTIEEVDISIRREQDRQIATTGKGFDLIVDDYPAKLTTQQASKGNMPRRHSEQFVYEWCTNLALDLNCHFLDVIQTNREGAKVNQARKGTDRRLIGMEDVNETWGAMTTATNVIAISRSPQDEAKQVATFHIVKTRGAEKGWSIVTKTDFGCCRTHGWDLPYTAYRGTLSLGDQIESLLQSYAGGAVPQELVPL